MKIRQVIPIAILAILLTVAVAYADTAGVLDPTNDPDNTHSYTLGDIYQRLAAGTAGSQSTWTEPLTGPGGTLHSINDIMDEAPAVVDDTVGATTAQVMSGKTYWGLRDGEWGPQTGDAAMGSDVSGADGKKTFDIPDGYYEGKTATANDSDLLAENIRCGVTIFGVDGSRPPECVAKTGQTTCYDALGNVIVCAGTGQDGEYQRGCSPAVALAVGSDFGGYNRTSFSCTAGFTDNGNGTVTDNLTGLIWLKDASCAELAGTNALGLGYWTTALSAANSLAEGTCGLMDLSSAGEWRLPNANELNSLFDPGLTSPYLPAGHPFTGVESFFYWSSSSAINIERTAYIVTLNSGLGLAGDKDTNQFYIWPVRGGQ